MIARTHDAARAGMVSVLVGSLLLNMDMVAAVVARDMGCLILGCHQRTPPLFQKQSFF